MKIKNPYDLSITFLDNGSIKSIHSGPIRVSLKESTPYSPPEANVFLRKRSTPVSFIPLTGPGSPGAFKVDDDVYISSGEWEGLDYICSIRLAEDTAAWQWQVEVRNNSAAWIDLDLVCVQDVGLKQAGAGPVNEYYMAQYLERRILEDERYGAVLCCRQNMQEAGGHPWLMMASKNAAVAGSTDGMQFYGRTCRATGIPEGLLAETPGGEYAGESPVVALQEKPFRLGPGQEHTSLFAFLFLPDHPEATSSVDLKRLPWLFKGTPSLLQGLHPSSRDSIPPPGTPSLATMPLLPAEDLSDEELNHLFGQDRRHIEIAEGKLLSFFSHDISHVVLRHKESLADRPHAHIMQAGPGLVPDESMMSTTAFMFGVFNSHITQGNTNFNTLLSVCTSQFNQSRETGQRIALTTGSRQFLLGVPSAFEMGLNHCRWIYKYGELLLQVRTWTSRSTAQINLDLKVLRGLPVDLLITHDFDPLNNWTVFHDEQICESAAIPSEGSMLRNKFPDARFRMIVHSPVTDIGFLGMESHEKGWSPVRKDGVPGQEMESLFVIRAEKTSSFCMSFVGEVCHPADATGIKDADEQWLNDRRDAIAAWHELSHGLKLTGDQKDFSAIRAILPWYGLDALIHYLTPYGLEQFGGAAWGTRDVSQGPVELLLTLGKYTEARQVLSIIFSNQNPDGGWPQWWMFDSYREIRAQEAHGDIFYWCILALGSYIKTTGDISLLDEVLPYYHEKGPEYAEKTRLSEHVERLIEMITDSFVPGTALVPFGGGDWNDSLQPVSEDLAGRMISAWTVEMNYQAFMEYQKIYELTGNLSKSDKLGRICEKIKTDFNTYLVRDGIVAGYGLVHDDGNMDVLLHPSDDRTGIHYSLLPMERGILSGIFSADQALFHLELIEGHLKGPDGARLMDRPLKYKGGVQEIFRRAESSTFFGREIGLMYVHEHIRYAEALAIMGKAEEFVKALRQAIPVGYRDVVPQGDIRQANCYYSSSDVHFRNRYEADERYKDVISGKLTVRGGWRVYSSGPGIYVSLIIIRLLGLRVENENIIIDPVLPNELDDISTSLEFLGYPVTFRYLVKEGNFSPKMISVNGNSISFSHEENQYRRGGAVISKSEFISFMDKKHNVVEVNL